MQDRQRVVEKETDERAPSMAAMTISPQVAMGGMMLADVKAAPTQALKILLVWCGCKAKELGGLKTLAVLVALAQKELESRGVSSADGR